MHVIGSMNILSSVKTHWAVIYLVFALVSISYFPTVVGTAKYSIVSFAIIGLMGIFLTSSIKDIWQSFGKYIVGVTFMFGIVSYFTMMAYDFNFFKVSSNLFLSFLCFSIGYFAPDITRNKVNLALMIYCISSCAMGLYSVFRNVGQFIITEQYAILLKNSSGVIVATGVLIALFLAIESKGNYKKTFWAIIGLLNFASLLVFRARSALLGILLSLVVIIIKSYAEGSVSRRYVMLAIISVVALYCFDIISFDLIYDSMFSNKDVSNMDSLSSGRTIMFERAMAIFNEHELGGNMAAHETLYTIDNFIINILGRYGLIGAITNFPFYILIWYITFKGLYKSDVTDLLPYCALLILCIVSLTEAPFPFGPGTPCICAYVLLGLHLNYYQNGDSEICEALAS